MQGTRESPKNVQEVFARTMNTKSIIIKKTKTENCRTYMKKTKAERKENIIYTKVNPYQDYN